jgi:hypothetical protein
MVDDKKNELNEGKNPYHSLVENGPESIACTHCDFVQSEAVIASNSHRNLLRFDLI